uniref:Uncharacterized protein n=1 Tax=Romanomermis culicivorax TaxID=13658 RepID=A0A915KWD4_ROMCU
NDFTIIFSSFCGAPLLYKLSAPPVVHFVDLHVDFRITTLPATGCPKCPGSGQDYTKLAAKSSKERVSTTLSATLLDNARKNLNKPAVIVNQLPFISVSSAAKESLLDEFDSIEDEYNPLYPNDYERVVKRREEEKRKLKDEERRNCDDRKKCRTGRSYDSSEEDEEGDDYYESRREIEKRHVDIKFVTSIAGAAIAPPSSLTRDSSPSPPSMSDDRSSYQPTFGSGSKGFI